MFVGFVLTNLFCGFVSLFLLGFPVLLQDRLLQQGFRMSFCEIQTNKIYPIQLATDAPLITTPDGLVKYDEAASFLPDQPLEASTVVRGTVFGVLGFQLICSVLRTGIFCLCVCFGTAGVFCTKIQQKTTSN